MNQDRDHTERALAIELLLLDVDGVLTDGSVFYSDQGSELKRFHVRDGSGLKLWLSAGKRAAIISGRKSAAVERRAKELGIQSVREGRDDKLAAFEELLSESGLTPSQICTIGDDLPDLPAMRLSGLAIAVADACREVIASADHVTSLPGGRGAVREGIEWLLKLQGRWDDLIARYLG